MSKKVDPKPAPTVALSHLHDKDSSDYTQADWDTICVFVKSFFEAIEAGNPTNNLLTQVNFSNINRYIHMLYACILICEL